MNRSKYFTIIIVITAIMLFILGTWATSAQATSIGILDVTPIPTGTLVVTPATPIGAIPSPKEQEELKAAVQSYVELRYRALSMSDSEDFRRNGLGDLISDMHKAKIFLSEETAKLAVEIKRAAAYHLRYVDYKYFLDFQSITVDPATGTATIAMMEGNEVIYEISAELNPVGPIVSHTAGIEHTILLHKAQGQWKIVSDVYNDDLWKMLRHGGKSTDEILQTSDEMIRILEASPKSLITRQANTQKLPTYTLPNDPSSHPYDRAGAVEYAFQHWNNSTGQYNLNYWNYKPNDCQNFVSQALYEGGNVTMYIPYPDDLQPSDSGWYYLDYGIDSLGNVIDHTGSGWSNVIHFFTRTTLDPNATSYDPNNQDTWPETWKESDPYNQGPEGVLLGTLNPQVDELNNVNNIPARLEPGDIILYEWGDSQAYPDTDTAYDHSALVVAMDGGFPFIAAHTDDHYGIPYTQTVNPIQEVRFIHIERSNGYPPVKAQIEQEQDAGNVAGQSSNDAGPNPIANCDFATGFNEVYFGVCQNGSEIDSGFRFKNIDIPPGAQIKYAYLTFTVDGPFTEPMNIDIYGENVANSNYFSVGSQPKDRASLTTSRLWPIGEPWDLGQRATTPNLSTIVASIVANGWQNGDPLSFIFKPAPGTVYNHQNMRRVVSFERAGWDGIYSPLSPAKLIAAYTMDNSNTPPGPTVVSITRVSQSPTNNPLVAFQVTFSEPVTNVDSDDFTLFKTSSDMDAFISQVTGSDNLYEVIVNTGTKDGKIRVDVNNDALINSMANPNQQLIRGFASGQMYTIDKTAPTVWSIIRDSANPTGSSSVDFTVTFYEPVTGVDTDDFTPFSIGVTGASVTKVSLIAGMVYRVSVNTGQGDGAISLHVLANGTIKDYAANVMNEEEISSPYVIDKTPPTVLSIVPVSANPTSSSIVDYTVTFSEPIFGVKTSDFRMTADSIPNAFVSAVSGSSTTYTVTVDTGGIGGKIRIDLADDDTIMDMASLSLGGPGIGNGNFTTSDEYSVIILLPTPTPTATSAPTFTPTPTPTSTPTSTPTPVSGGAQIDTMIGSVLKGSYYVGQNFSQHKSYTGLSNGPVYLHSINNVPIVPAEGMVYNVNGVNTSYSELMALPSTQLDTTYWMPWYNNLEMETKLRLTNVSGTTATVHVYLAGVEKTSGDPSGSPYTVLPGKSVVVSYPGANGGPMKIVSSVPIITAEQLVYKENGIAASYAEMLGFPNSQLETTYWMPWYNNVEMESQVRIGNVSSTLANVHVYIGGVEMSGSPFSLNPNTATRLSFATINGGPVKVVSNVNVVASVRGIYNGADHVERVSYSEMMGLPNGQATTIFWFPSYDNSSLNSQFRFTNVGSSPATVRIYVGGIEVISSNCAPSNYPYLLTPGASLRVSCTGANGGSARIVSTTTIVAAKRILYNVNGTTTSFSEMMGVPGTLMKGFYWLPWYDNVNLNTELILGAYGNIIPGGQSLTIPGNESSEFTLPSDLSSDEEVVEPPAIGESSITTIEDGSPLLQVLPIGADQDSIVTFTNVDAPASEQRYSGTWDENSIAVLYDTLNQRIQLWTYSSEDGWTQHGEDVRVIFEDGDTFRTRALADGTVKIYRNGSLFVILP